MRETERFITQGAGRLRGKTLAAYYSGVCFKSGKIFVFNTSGTDL